MEPSITRQYGPQFRARCRRRQVPHESGGDKGFTASMASCNRVPGDDHVQMGSREGREKSPFNRAPDKVIARHLPVSRSVSGARSPIRAADAAARHRTRIGTPIHFAPIAWRVHLLAAVEHLAAGHGGSGIAGTMACQPHSERHQRPIGNAHTRKVQDFVVYAGNRFIASAGMPTYGTPAQTRMRPGTAPVWSHGNSGPHQVTTLGS